MYGMGGAHLIQREFNGAELGWMSRAAGRREQSWEVETSVGGWTEE